MGSWFAAPSHSHSPCPTPGAGIGENGSLVRELACEGLEWAGVAVDPTSNEATVRGRGGAIQAPGSRVKVRGVGPQCSAAWSDVL